MLRSMKPGCPGMVPWICMLLFPAPAGAADYLKDFEFLSRTVAARSASIRARRIDWKRASARMRPRFAACASDREHVRNVMELLAAVQDSHTGVVRSGVGWDGLPSKWDGLYGGGLWFAWEAGRVMLRGIMEGHPKAGSLRLGSVLTDIDELPCWIVVEREKRRITRFCGSSSDHSLFSSMGNRFLPFGDAQQLKLTFTTPGGKAVSVTVPRWGPGGKAFYPHTVQLPEGVTYGKGAVSGLVKTPWSEKVGYLRITGAMNDETVRAFHRAMDALKGMKALMLDCRGMGGGGDAPAWAMAGRFFPTKVVNGPGRMLEPTGSWQFEGPVVMLQDETEVSSAETFTWAMSETGRVVSVGRPTGGWGIIPTAYKCPSGLVDFRLGVNNRPTPIKRIQTEGIGWPPDVLIPYGPLWCARKDPVREVGMEMLMILHAGIPRKAAVRLFGGLFEGDIAGFRKTAGRYARNVRGWKPDAIAATVAKDIEGTLALEYELLNLAVPDVRAAMARLDSLAPVAKKAKQGRVSAKLKKMANRLKREADAQEAFLTISDAQLDAPAKAKAAFVKRYGKTRVGRCIATKLWR